MYVHNLMLTVESTMVVIRGTDVTAGSSLREGVQHQHVDDQLWPLVVSTRRGGRRPASQH